jgi:hypothetical protein
MTPDRFARMIYVGEESVRQMLKAAEVHGAIAIVEGDWIIVKWRQYQSDESAPERMRRHRANQKERESVTDVTRNARNVTDVTTTETETETETISPLPPKGAELVLAKGLSLPFESLEFSAAWTDWVAYRKQIKKPLAEKTQVAQLAMLGKLNEPRAIGAIRLSIEKGWQGLFPDKAPAPPNMTPMEALNRRAQEILSR